MAFDLATAKPVSSGFDLSTAKPVGASSTDEPGMLASLGAGLGKGFGQVVLNAQKYAGKGVEALGGGSSPTVTDLVSPGSGGNLVQRAGRWLQSDADAGLKKIEGENAPYKQANPITNGVGEFGGEFVATLPVGGAAAKVISKVPGAQRFAPNLLDAIASSGMKAGTSTGVANALTRAGGAAIAGGLSAGLVNPDEAGTGAVIGAVTPGAVKVVGAAGNMLGTQAGKLTDAVAERLMQSALKPTIKQLQNGEAATAVRTLLDYGINPTKAGVNKLRDLIEQKNTEIADQIANSTASVDKGNVLASLSSSRQKFANQVSPTADLEAIQRVADDFTAHPNFPGSTIPVQDAQALKQGTYKVLSKKYGQLGAADVEAQKDLARGLKEEIATAVPGVGPLNAEESRLLQALNVTERRALMDANKNTMGLAALAKNPLAWASFMADRSAAFKSLAARLANRAPDAASAVGNALSSPGVEQLVHRGAPVLAADR